MEKTEKYEVEGFLFETKEEAELARKEADAIRYLKKMNNMKNPKVMYQVYEKMISQKLFVTPIGREYLKNLQRQLLGRYEKKDIPSIPVINADCDKDVSYINSRKKMLQFDDVGNYYTKKIRLLKVIILMLVDALGFMIFLAATTKSAHILNYEKSLVNRYEQWEQELDEREQKLNDETK